MIRPVIKSFKSEDAKEIFDGVRTRKFPAELQRAARRKLLILDAAERLGDLAVPPGNRLEALRGSRTGQHSIRINDRWRICFRWTGADAEAVEIVDYH